MELFFGLLIGAVGAVGLVFLRQKWNQETIHSAEEAAQHILDEAKKEGSVIKREAQVQAKDTVLQAKSEAEREINERRKEIQQVERVSKDGMKRWRSAPGSWLIGRTA